MAPRTSRQQQLLAAHRLEEAKAKGGESDAAAAMHANDKKLFDKLQEKRAKVDSLKFEMSRIKVKEWEDGLTAGQERQVKINESLIEKLLQEIEDEEENLRDRYAACMCQCLH
jgi:hypothetical protein